MNLKRKINCCRKQESYSVSFYMPYKSMACKGILGIPRNFLEFLYSGLFVYITLKFNLTFLLREN